MYKKIQNLNLDKNYLPEGSDILQAVPPLNSALTKASESFNERLKIFTLVVQLNHLCRGVQRHRGLSIGLLAGNKSFLDNFLMLQEQINRRVQIIAAFVGQSPSLLSKTDLERLHYAWNTIKDNWQQDSVLENFEFHSYFVDQLLATMARLLDKIRAPYSEKIQECIDQENNNDLLVETEIYQNLVEFSQKKLTRFIELLGKIRALSVYAAVSGSCTKEHEKKLDYLLQCVDSERDSLFESTVYLHSKLADRLPSLLTIRTYEYKLDFLLEKMSSDFLNVEVVHAKEEEVFNLVTDIIDVYWRVVDDSLNLMNLWQQDDLERWLISG